MEANITYKTELIRILVEINRLVTEHLKIQKSVFNPTIRGKIPRLFKKADFESLYKASKKIQTELYQTIRGMHKDKKELSIDPFVYTGIKDYALIFHTSSEKLTRIVYELSLKAKKQNNLTEQEYNQLLNEYEKIENARMQKGSTIQKIAFMLANN